MPKAPKAARVDNRSRTAKTLKGLTQVFPHLGAGAEFCQSVRKSLLRCGMQVKQLTFHQLEHLCLSALQCVRRELPWRG